MVLVQEMRTKHESRSVSDMQEWMRSHKDPEIRAKGESVARKLQWDKEVADEASLQTDAKEEKREMRQAEFRSLNDMRALTWLCAHAVRYASGITSEHINEFCSMRMLEGETPKNAAAKAQKLADIISESGVAHEFNYEYELTNLLTNPDLKGGAFFTNAIFNKIEVHVRTEIRANKWVRPTHNEHIRLLWVSMAEEYFNETIGRETNKLMIQMNHDLITKRPGTRAAKAVTNPWRVRKPRRHAQRNPNTRVLETQRGLRTQKVLVMRKAPVVRKASRLRHQVATTSVWRMVPIKHITQMTAPSCSTWQRKSRPSGRTRKTNVPKRWEQ